MLFTRLPIFVCLLSACWIPAARAEGPLHGVWCNTSPVELEAGIKSVQCGPGTVGLTLASGGKEFRLAGVELLCGEEISPVFLPFHLSVLEGELYTTGFRVGSLGAEGASFTLGNEDFTATEFTFRAEAGGALFYDEATRDLEGWIINRNRGHFRKIPAGTRTCAGAAN
jgi:hypothetical protein